MPLQPIGIGRGPGCRSGIGTGLSRNLPHRSQRPPAGRMRFDSRSTRTRRPWSSTTSSRAPAGKTAGSRRATSSFSAVTGRLPTTWPSSWTTSGKASRKSCVEPISSRALRARYSSSGALGFRTPRYGHLPVLTEPDGQKLAKSRRAVPLDARAAPRQLWQVLEWLEQAPPPELASAPVKEIWAWAIPNWRPERLEGHRERRLPPAARD